MLTAQAPTATRLRTFKGLVGTAICLAFLAAAGLAAAQQAAPDDMAIQKRIQEIGLKLNAPCCPNLTVAQHESPTTLQMKKEIRAMLLGGKTEGEILDAKKAKYGEAVLAESPLGGWKLWTIVGGALVALALVILAGRFMMTHEHAPAALHVVEEEGKDKGDTQAA